MQGGDRTSQTLSLIRLVETELNVSLYIYIYKHIHTYTYVNCIMRYLRISQNVPQD